MSQKHQKYGSQIPWGSYKSNQRLLKVGARSRAYPKILSVNLWHQKIQRYSSQQNLWGDIVLDYTK